jgi:type IV pilus assembly protein PilM
MARAFWGIDISRTSVKAVRLELRKDGAVLTRLATASYRGGGEEQIDEAGLREALTSVRKEGRIGGEPVAVTLASHSTFNRLLRLPPVPEEQVAEIVRYEAQSQIPFPLEEVYWGHHVVVREYGPGEEREVILLAAKREVVESFLKMLEPVGLNFEVVQFAPVALYNFLVYDQEIGAGTIVLDVGAENTDLVLVDHGKFWIRNIPITGNQFTKAIAAGLKVKMSDAEKLKRHPGKYQTKVYGVLRGPYQELTSEIHRSLGYYKSSVNRTLVFQNVLLLGNGSKAAEFKRFLNQALGIAVTPVNRLSKIAIGPQVDQALLAANLPALGPAIGLALQGLGLAVTRVNLLPPSKTRERVIRKKGPWAVGAAAALLATAIAAGGVLANRVTGWEKIDKDIREIDGKYQGLVARADQARSMITPVQQAMDALHQLTPPRGVDLELLRVIFANLPDNPSLTQDREHEQMWLLSMNVELVSAEEQAAQPVGMTRQQESYVPARQKLVAEVEVAYPRIFGGNRSQQANDQAVIERLLNIRTRGNSVERANEGRPSLLDIVGGDPQRIKVSPTPSSASPRNRLIAERVLEKTGAAEVRSDPNGKYHIAILRIEVNLAGGSP